MYKVDYHLHTNYSMDSSTKMETMILRAAELSLDEICLTDHVDYAPWMDLSPDIHQIDYDIYLNEFTMLKEKYKTRIKIKLGCEIGLEPDLNETISKFAASYPFDFIIGSTHDVEKLDLYQGDFFVGKDKVTAFTIYFEEILENIKNIKDFCVYGHIDYVRRYGGYTDNSLFYRDYGDIIDEILRALIENGKGLEINTSGFRYGLNQLHPQQAILERYRELGGELLTIGSDAHDPKYIADNYDTAVSAIKQAGFDRIAVFEKMKPEWVLI